MLSRFRESHQPGNNNLIGTKDLVASLIATVPVSASLVLGQKLHDRINEELFRRVHHFVTRFFRTLRTSAATISVCSTPPR